MNLPPAFPSAFGGCKPPLLVAKRLSGEKSFSHMVLLDPLGPSGRRKPLPLEGAEPS